MSAVRPKTQSSDLINHICIAVFLFFFYSKFYSNVPFGIITSFRKVPLSFLTKSFIEIHTDLKRLLQATSLFEPSLCNDQLLQTIVWLGHPGGATCAT